MTTFEQKLEKYAELVVKVGVNIQPNQVLTINTTIDSAPLVRLITKKAYEVGAKFVNINWSDDCVNRTRYELAPEDTFNEHPKHRAAELIELAQEGGAFLSIVSSSPSLMQGIDSSRIANQQKASSIALQPYRKMMMSDQVSWCVIAAPSQGWADMVFPNEEKENRIPLLWEAIFKAVRVDLENPIEAWVEHNDTLHTKVDYLNNKKYKKLHYLAPGTDLTIELPEKHLWCGAGSVNVKGHEFMANMPTEEVFTLPKKDGVNGFVSSTKPLSYGGNIIDEFTVTFENGRIIKTEAKVGQEILEKLVETDEGSHYLGEVALVPHFSPISESNILFYNTLFDENASNHLAIGNGYAFCLDGGKTMSQEELKENGCNESLTHVDFMIGSDKMDIYGVLEDGTKELVFKQGNWAF